MTRGVHEIRERHDDNDLFRIPVLTGVDQETIDGEHRDQQTDDGPDKEPDFCEIFVLTGEKDVRRALVTARFRSIHKVVLG